MNKREKVSLAELWLVDAGPPADDDDRCGCVDCKLKFHSEMAAWAREQLMQQVVPAPCKSKDAKNKDAKSKDAKSKGAKSKGTIKDAKGKDTEDKGKGKDYPRGFMPWNEVIRKVGENTFIDSVTVKLILDAVKVVATEEIKEGRAFHFRGLAGFKLVTGPRVVAQAAEGRAFDAIKTQGLANSDS